MPETKIEDVPELKDHAERLQSLGYRNTDQVVGAAKAAGDSLARYLKLDGKALEALMRSIPRRPQPKGIQAPALRKGALGVRLDRVPRPRRALMMSAIAATPLPPMVNRIAEMRPVRDQAERGTCVAHAATAAAEHYWRSQNQVVDLSRQFLYWDCKQHDGHPDEEGTWIGVAMPQLQSDGCCLEAAWPYVTTQGASEGQGPAPDGATAAAAPYKIPSFRQLAPASLLDIKGELARGRCVAFSIPVYNSWYQNDEVARTGEIVNPIPGEEDVGGHAMCFVGYQDIAGEPDLGGGKFYLRNSWDSYWATESVLGQPGYGTIPYSYIARFGSEAYSID
ncbi:MAG: C1 family peptidase [Acidobacteriia bacterium]|nr:C1 family peptidase [Terriglobia bacterium]